LAFSTGLAIVYRLPWIVGAFYFCCHASDEEVGIRKVLGRIRTAIVALFRVILSAAVIGLYLIAIPIIYCRQPWLSSFAFHITLDGKLFSSAIILWLISLTTVGIICTKAAMPIRYFSQAGVSQPRL